MHFIPSILLSLCVIFSVVSATSGEFTTIAVVYQLFYQHGRFVNRVHMGEGFAHFMQGDPFYYRKHGMSIIYYLCRIVSRTDFQSAQSQRRARVLESSCTWMHDEENGVDPYEV